MSLKWFVASLLIIDRFFVFVLAVWEALFEHEPIKASLMIYPFLHTFTLLAMLIATNEVRKAGIHSSGVLFCTWMAFALAAVPEFYQWVVIGSQPELVAHIDFFRYVAYLTYFPLVVAEFALHFVSDPFPMPDSIKNSNCPEENANFLSRQFLSWFTQLISKGNKKTIDIDDIFDLSRDLDQDFVNSLWDKEWKRELKRVEYKNMEIKQKSSGSKETEPLIGNVRNYGAVEDIDDEWKNKPSVIGTLWRIVKWEFLAGCFIKFIGDMLNFANPLFLNLLITYIETPGEPQYVGIALAFGLFIFAEIKSFIFNNFFVIMTRVSTKIQIALSCAIYKKALRISNTVRKNRTTGEMVNLMAIDIDRFRMIIPQLQQYWSSPVQIILCLVLLWQIVGYSVLAGVVVMVSIIPLNFGLSVITKRWQLKLMKYKDERIKLVNEVLNGIKVVKLVAWETAMEKKIEEIRAKELHMIRKSMLVQNFSNCLNVATPVFVAIFTFALFTISNPNNVLTPNIAFVSISLFNLLRGPLMMAADLVSQTVQCIVSNKRIKSFLLEDEIDEEAVNKELRGELYHDSVEVHNASFAWEKHGNKQLSFIDMKVKSNELVSVVGSVGSGKSSLLLATLGEMEKINGYVGVRGSVAYVSQQPWILNQSLRQNIIMQSEFNKVLYDKIVEACALKEDLKQLPDGDLTEIGEKGVNLSGGQKARISLARAVYQNKDVYFLDDPLSAVDAHVAKHIFKNVIGPNGLLSHTTRVFVTNTTSFLKESDRILVLKGGVVHHFDTFDNLMKNDEARVYLEEVNEEELEKAKEGETEEEIDFDSDDEQKSSVSIMSKSSSRKKKSVVSKMSTKTPKALITKEEAASGKVKFSIYMLYFKSMGILKYVLPYIITVLINMGLSMGRSLWLSAWSDANIDPANPDKIALGVRLGIFSAFGFSEIIFLFLSLTFLILGGIEASRNLHGPLVHNVLRNPLSYFDVTPTGRIINRLAKDIEIVDLQLSGAFRFLFIGFLNLMQTIIIVTYSTPAFILVIIPVFFIYYFIFRYSINSTRQLRRVASVTKSPIFSNFSETLLGISTIRAFDWNSEFIRRNEIHVYNNVRSSYYSAFATRWLSVRLELLGNTVILAASLLAILSKDSGLTAGMLGLSVSYSLNITFMLNMFVRQISEVETNVVAVERIDQYSKNKGEAPWRTPFALPKNWPTNGSVTLTSYSCRYRDELELVLKNIDLDIQPGQKVGVCGRTGAGKSSLALALFRIVEAAEGRIHIDDIDTRKMGLHDLRENLTIIPQENVLFANTLRFNIDPQNEYSDAQIWRALEHSNLKTHVESLPLKLESLVSEGGDNFSVGQRQLLCLTRALLKKSKILVLDEATAGIDNRTDALVQATIRKEFADSTIITIAHRLNTILDYDRIIVMENGKIVEDGVPNALLNDKNSKFYSLAKSSKIVS
ncbi:unnamed protein product [Caenorhabditis bovis]|uniref:ABC-type glutathione-S-conjugate transporter n=1 Tax=Caenorhabditis bovis TaxID=2654633 RepID=A0A8S1EI20_9PELO|nr:unnamed protein product [Caenorhabditis bovis]